ncbi:response regulator transcription factor [Symbioplanes lichenis]|uniref:response regulator transcription factor n=1 Tax=Symbioplanes lichenis TaxID=1629072 RepID=UPI002739E522|nr:LuxR C-terminal-related transcriptional regulator [Actinoplanes lichenis]
MRLILAEDSILLREGLVRLLTEEGHEVLAAVGDGDALLREVDLLKDRVSRVEEFLDSLERVHGGGAAIDPEVVRQLLARTTHVDPLSKLTNREREVLDQMAQGHTNAAIAAKLYISQSAVEKNVNMIFEKLDLTRTTGYSRRVLAVLHYLGS